MELRTVDGIVRAEVDVVEVASGNARGHGREVGDAVEAGILA